MKKISLLATSVAIALTGCGGGSGGGSSDGNTTRDGVVLTGFDGYFKNAVVFVDNNNNGQWDQASDTFLGLTDSRGQLNVGSTKPEGTLAIQTLTPNGAAQSKLIALDAEKYAGVYTVDMDLPGQPMEHELVFRAPNSSNVISPITDLVAIEIESGKSLEEAEAAVTEALTGQTDGEIDLYSDYVEGAQADAKLHKTAQILTETKAANPNTYQGSATEIAKQADQAVEEIAENNPDLLDEDSFKPVVPVAGDGSVTPIPSDTIENPSFKTTVNDDVYDAIQDAIDTLELELGMPGSRDYFIELDLTGLFEDKDVEEIDLGYIKVDGSSLDGSNIQTVYNYQTNKLNIGVSPSAEITKAGEFEIIVMVGNSDDTNYTPAYFTLDVDEGEAEAPEYSEDTLAGLQDGASLWQLVKGQDLGEGYSLDFSELFSGDSELTLSFSSNATSNGLIFDAMGSGLIGVQGTPTRSADEDDTEYTIKLIATDQSGLVTSVEIELPDVQQAATPEPGPLHPLEGKEFFFIETAEEEDDSDLNYCVSFKFEQGKAYFTAENYAGDMTNTCAPLSTSVGAEYTVNGDIITMDEGGEDPMTFELLHKTGNDGEARYIIKTVELNEDEDNYPSTFEAYDNKPEAERRINLTSNSNWENRVTTSSLWVAGEYVDVNMTLQMENDGQQGDLDVYFDRKDGGNITCDDVNELFSSRYASDANATQCFDDEENDVKFAVFDFDYSSTLVNNKVYAIRLDSADADKAQHINFNVTFDGNSFEE